MIQKQPLFFISLRTFPPFSPSYSLTHDLNTNGGNKAANSNEDLKITKLEKQWKNNRVLKSKLCWFTVDLEAIRLGVEFSSSDFNCGWLLFSSQLDSSCLC
ncbi:hypothetical protein A4A49_20591 [Nicotiana attenuata]|uniref:Uncharacterized protein n=1 Tax=Nicotiana attenuata TaxID=49451 RepID=A0A1J6KSA5_NICAT|nr:hypothetical protein A4A49_20591 [Nicotiana attenuata]